jgi:hypothetical protein
MREPNRCKTLLLIGIVASVSLILLGAGDNKKKAPPASRPSATSPSALKLAIKSVLVRTTFQVRVGGGANINAPDAFGGGGGIPLISIQEGSTFLPGEVSSKDGKTKLIKIVFTVENPLQETKSFKIGDIALVVGEARWNDFMAVGYGDKLCAMSDTDRRTVKEIVVDVAPKGTRTLSYVFPFFSADSKQGELVLGNSTSVSFTIDEKSGK